jgi:predicted RNase H-like nuclease (RuvC/YqgF family)
MPTATLERFPKTVSACHVEIIRLRKELEGGDADRIVSLEEERDELKDEIETASKEIDDLEERVKKLEENEHPDVIDAVDNFLYQVERPVGEFKFDVIHEAATDRAIVRLFDAVGRRP